MAQLLNNTPPGSPLSMTSASPPGSPVASIDGDTRTRTRTQTQSSIRNRRRRAQVVNPDNDEEELIERERRRLRELQNFNRQNDEDDNPRGAPSGRPTMSVDLSSLRGRNSPTPSVRSNARTNVPNDPSSDPNDPNANEDAESTTGSVVDDGLPKRWTAQEELILQKWAEVAKSYAWMHNRAFYNYRWQNFWFSIPVIILSNLTGIANFAQSSIPDSDPNKKLFPLVIGAVNITAGIITTIYQFLKVSELLEAHRAAHIGYAKFARDIETELMQIRTLRSQHGRDFLRAKHDEFDRLITTSPIIPRKILNLFSDKFGTNKRCHSNERDYVVTSRSQRCCDVVYNGCICIFGRCCKRSCNICFNKADSPETIKSSKSRTRSDPNSPHHLNGDDDNDDSPSSTAQALKGLEDGRGPTTDEKCSRKINCRCNKCQPFCRPEINNIEPIAICTINEEDDNENNYGYTPPLDDVDENNPPNLSDAPADLMRDASGNLQQSNQAAGHSTQSDDSDDEHNHPHGHPHHRRGRSFAQNRRQSALLAERRREQERDEAHKRQMESSKREQEKLMETLTRLQDATQIQMQAMQERQNQEKEQKERQLQMDLADNLFSRAENHQQEENKEAKREENIKNGRLELQTTLSKTEAEELHKKHPPLPPSQFLEMAKKFREEQEQLMNQQQVEVQINRPVPQRATTPPSSPIINTDDTGNTDNTDDINNTDTNDTNDNIELSISIPNDTTTTTETTETTETTTTSTPKFNDLKNQWERRSSTTGLATDSSSPFKPVTPRSEDSSGNVQDPSGNNL